MSGKERKSRVLDPSIQLADVFVVLGRTNPSSSIGWFTNLQHGALHALTPPFHNASKLGILRDELLLALPRTARLSLLYE
jgi:hypothetical protein